MIGEQQAGDVDTTFRDRQAGLIGMGIAQLFLGGLCVLLMLLTVFMMVIQQKFMAENETGMPPQSPVAMLPALLIYGGLAIWFVTAGIGSIRYRRWAPALVSAVSSLWLAGGLVAVISMAVFLPRMVRGQVENSPQLPANFASIMIWWMMGIFTLLEVMLPAVLLLFYARRDVAATCWERDRHDRWTDGIPIPVLALSLLFWFWTACLPMMGFYGWAFPFFGILLQGASGAAAVAVTMVVTAAVAWSFMKRKIEGWVGALILTALWCLSGYLTLRNMSMLELYQKMGFPEDQLKLMEQMNMPGMNSIMLVYGLGALILVGALLYSHRFFKRID